jgi:hypothetical protein
MKKSQLRQIIKEELRGYSPQIGRTKGGTSDEFMQILTKIAKGRPEDKQEGDKDFPPLPHEKLHGYSQKTTPEGEHETWAIYFDPKTNTYNERHRVPGETIFGRKGNADKGNEILDKANPDNVARISRGEDPIYEGEGVKNVYSKHPYIKDLLNAFIHPDGTVGLAIHPSKGGLPVKQAAVVPMDSFTPEYVEKQVSSVYDVDSQFRQGIQQFVDSVHSNG